MGTTEATEHALTHRSARYGQLTQFCFKVVRGREAWRAVLSAPHRLAREHGGSKPHPDSEFRGHTLEKVEQKDRNYLGFN